MNKQRKVPNTVRYWLIYGVVVGACIGAGLYLLMSDDFEILGLVGSVTGFVVAMVLAGQVVRLMTGTSDDES